MTIPTWMLTEEASVRPYEGRTGYNEPRYGDWVTIRCFIEPRVQVVRDRNGQETVAMARMITTPDVVIPAHSEVLWNATPYDVIDAAPLPSPFGGRHHLVVLLR